jgi:NAD-dependent deacetylase
MGSWLTVPWDAEDVRVLETDAGDRPIVENTPECVARLIQRHGGSVVAVTGAGISSHQLPTFRSNDNSGFWELPESNAVDRASFYDNPSKSWRILATLRDMQLRGNLTPSRTHRVLHEFLQRHFISHIITQNIDGLHSFPSDADRVIELHGAVRDYAVCERCHAQTAVDCIEILRLKQCPRCPDCEIPLKPPVAFFGDVIDPDKRERARAAMIGASLVLLVGTHLTVDPVLSMVAAAKDNGAVIVEVNLQPTPGSRLADVTLYGRADDTLAAVARIVVPEIEFESSKETGAVEARA